MKSSKWMIGLVAIMLILAIAPSSFAQVQIQIFNTPSGTEIKTGRNVVTADPGSVGAGILVSGSLVANSTLTTTTLTLTFPAPITSSVSAVDGTVAGGTTTGLPASDPLIIQGATGLFASVSAVATVNYSAGTIQITLPGFGAATNALSGSFRVSGVRMDVNGKTAPLTVTGSLGSSANNYINQSTTQTLITALGDGIASGSLATGTFTGLTNQGTALMFTNQTNATYADATTSFKLDEGFVNAWRTATQSATNGSPIANGTQIRLTIAGLPTGVTLTLSQNLLNGYAGTGGSPGITLSAGALTSTTTQTTITFTSTDTAKVESLAFDGTLTGTPTGTLTAGSITVTATMAPVQTSGFSTTTGTSIPNRNGVVFSQTDVGPLTVGNIVAANTTMLIPYAVKVGSYDTGIAIANTTADPFGTTTGGASPQAGVVTFTLYPRTDTGAGTSFALTTSASVRPGTGLATDGTVASGGTWTGLITDLMTAAGKTGDFFGYLFIQTSFLNAHGAAYIFDGRGFTSATPVLVLAPPQQTSRNTSTVESLNN